jgi:acetyl esterase
VALATDTQAYLDSLAGLPALETLSVEEARAGTEARAAELFGPVEEVASTEDRAIPGPNGPIRIRIYRPSTESRHPTLPALVYLHGGGWVIGSLDTHDGVCRALCARTPCVVVSVDYRLAPEHRFPAAVEDAWAATVWVWERAGELMVSPGKVAVGGDSAGGNLAAVMALRARDRRVPLPFQLLVYPVCDYDLETASYRENGAGYGLTLPAMRWFWDHYLGPDGDGLDPDASPLRAADVSGVAPAFVLTVENDPLLDEGEAYARRLRGAGVPVTLSRYDGVIHGFIRMPGVIERGHEALDECAGALRAAFAAQDSP